MNGEFPTRTLLVELPFAGSVLAAPLIQIRHLDSAAAGAEDVVSKDELVLRFALLEGSFEPLVLGIAHGGGPAVPVPLTAFAAAFALAFRSPLRSPLRPPWPPAWPPGPESI